MFSDLWPFSDQIFLSFPKIRKRQEFDENMGVHNLNLDEFRIPAFSQAMHCVVNIDCFFLSVTSFSGLLLLEMPC